MKHLWAPWRMKFIEELRDTQGGCIFCEVAQPGDDRERLILHRGTSCYVLMNRFPYNNGHLMIVPYRHLAKMVDLNSEENTEIMSLCAESVEILCTALEAEGVNCGLNIGRAAGAGILDHVHMHVVPRWNGDTNFLPVFSDTRSMPEYLHATYDRLIDGFKKLKSKT